MTARTEVRQAEQHWSRRLKRFEIWGAVSVETGPDGAALWSYLRADEERSFWEVRRSGCGIPVIYTSLSKARAATASGAAAALLDRAVAAGGAAA